MYRKSAVPGCLRLFMSVFVLSALLLSASSALAFKASMKGFSIDVPAPWYMVYHASDGKILFMDMDTDKADIAGEGYLSTFMLDEAFPDAQSLKTASADKLAELVAPIDASLNIKSAADLAFEELGGTPALVSVTDRPGENGFAQGQARVYLLQNKNILVFNAYLDTKSEQMPSLGQLARSLRFAGSDPAKIEDERFAMSLPDGWTMELYGSFVFGTPWAEFEKSNGENAENVLERAALLSFAGMADTKNALKRVQEGDISIIRRVLGSQDELKNARVSTRKGKLAGQPAEITTIRGIFGTRRAMIELHDIETGTGTLTLALGWFEPLDERTASELAQIAEGLNLKAD